MSINLQSLNKIRKTLLVVLIIGFGMYFPLTRLYESIVGVIGVFVINLKMFEGVPGIQELVIIEGIATIIFVGLSVSCSWLLYKKHPNIKLFIYGFLLAALIYYLLEPAWFRLSGFPKEYLDGKYYENPIGLLKPILVALICSLYFKISQYLESKNVNNKLQPTAESGD